MTNQTASDGRWMGSDFRVGRILDRTISTYRRNFLQFSLVTLAASAVPVLVATYGGNWSGLPIQTRDTTVIFVTAITAVVLALFSQSIIVHGAFQVLRSRPVNLLRIHEDRLAAVFSDPWLDHLRRGCDLVVCHGHGADRGAGDHRVGSISDGASVPSAHGYDLCRPLDLDHRRPHADRQVVCHHSDLHGGAAWAVAELDAKRATDAGSSLETCGHHTSGFCSRIDHRRGDQCHRDGRRRQYGTARRVGASGTRSSARSSRS